MKPFLLLVLLGLSACSNLVQVKIDVVDQRTALQNQVLGSYQRLEGEVRLFASVRSIDAEGRLVEPTPLPQSKRVALRAMRRSLYNRDDIDQLKSEARVGEKSDGYLSYREGAASDIDEKQKAFAKALVAQENEDRTILYSRVAEENEAFDSHRLREVEIIMAGLNRDGAVNGTPIQNEDGSWFIKGSRP